MDYKIKKIEAREILDSRGNPTVEATVILDNGSEGTAMVPSGASTGTHEAVELRDKQKRYNGKGVLKAIENVNTKINRALKGINIREIRKIDEIMVNLDGTKNKKKLGANAILSVSLAALRAGSNAYKTPLYKYIREVFFLREKGFKLPVPTMNVINGGAHADSGLSIQEFMIIPNAKNFAEKVRIGVEVFHSLKAVLKEENFTTSVGDEGGFAPKLKNNEMALVYLSEAVKKAGYKLGKDINFGMDIAASEFFDDNKYFFDSKNRWITGEKLIDTLKMWLKKYPIISIEDPISEDDFSNWKKITKELGEKVTLVGDDFFVTNTERLQNGIENQMANAILIKVNQIGTVSETIDAIYLAKRHNYKVSVSHRSGETADTFIADLSVAVNADFIKTGSLSRSERVEKYNRLMKIEKELGLLK